MVAAARIRLSWTSWTVYVPLVAVLVLVLAESCLLAVVGGALGLGAAWLLVARGDPTGGFLPIFYLPGKQLVIGAALVIGLGFVAGILPAWGAMRLRIVDALRRV